MGRIALDSRRRDIIVHWAFRHTLPKPKPLVRRPAPRSLDGLPDSLLHKIVGHISNARDVCVFGTAAKRFRAASEDEGVWKNLCFSKYGVPCSANPPSWRELYKFNHQFLHDVIMSKNPGKGLNFGHGRRIFIQIPGL